MFQHFRSWYKKVVGCFLNTCNTGIITPTSNTQITLTYINYFFKDFIYLFLERGKGGRKRGRETSVWERNINQLPFVCTRTRDQTCSPGMCPDWELNQWHFALQDNAHPTELHWSGNMNHFLIMTQKLSQVSGSPELAFPRFIITEQNRDSETTERKAES